MLSIIVTLMIFAFLALALDTGRLWVEKRQLQKIADMAALASARFTGCGGSLELLKKEATKVAKLNGLDGLDASQPTASITAKRGYLSTSASGEYIFNDVIGDLDATNASQITVGRQVPRSIIMGGLWGGMTELRATATASGGPPVSTYAMGASVLTIDNDFTRTLNAFMGGIFRKQANLDATMVQKLAASTVSLESLMKAGNFQTVDELLASEKTIGDLLDMYGDAAQLEGAVDPDVTKALSQLVNAAKPTKQIDVLNVKLRDVLSINPGNKDAVLDSQINLLNLVQTSVTVAGKNAKYDLDFNVNVAGVGARVQIGDVPQIGIGPGGVSRQTNKWCSRSKSTQTTLTFTLGEGLFSNLLDAVLFGLIQVDLKMKLSFGNAEAKLSYLEPNAGQANVHFLVDTNPMTLSITNRAETEDGFVGFQNGTARYGLAFGTIGENRQVQSAETEVNIPVSTPVEPTFRAGSSEMKGALAGLLNSIPLPRIVGGKFTGWLAFLNTLIEGVLDSISTLLMNTLGNLLATTIDPLMRILGVNFGSADITVYDVRNTMPRLVTVQSGE